MLRSAPPTRRTSPRLPRRDFPGPQKQRRKQFGEYCTRRLVIEAWEHLQAQGLMPEAYERKAVPVQIEHSIASPSKPISVTEDDQVFPWLGRETFVYESIPQLIALCTGKDFDYYRYAAVIASKTDHMRQLFMLSGNLSSLASLNSLLPSLVTFSEDQRIRVGEIRRALERKGIVSIFGNSVVLPDFRKITPPDIKYRQLLELAIEATDIFYEEKAKAAPGSQFTAIKLSLEQLIA